MSGAKLETFTTFGTLLRYLRQRVRMTQRELGIAVGYSDGQITRLESGQRTPDLVAVRARFLDALDLRDEPDLAQRLIDLAEQAQGSDDTRPIPLGNEDQPRAAPVLTNLPAQLARFIGREREVAEVRRLIGQSRLVTLTGAGGVGKTRLAVEVGASFVGAGFASTAPAFPGGVWLAELAPLANAALVPRAVAAVFRLAEDPDHIPEELLVSHLAGRHTLLILDNCEHLINACAALAEALMRGCPHLRVLATSREGLGVPGEVAWRVPSLSTPDPAHLPPLPQVRQYEAVELFIHCASAAQPEFALMPDNVTAIAQICRRLDGIPLAIEMAAAQVAALSVGEIATALDDMFALLGSGKRTALPRQQTLRATLDWSYALLSEPERLLLARLSAFVGGWTAEGAKAVCADTHAIHAPDVLPLLLQLVHKSLAVTEPRAVASDGGGVTRYRLLEPIRQYAAGKLRERGDDEVMATREQHWAYFVTMGEAENADDAHVHNAWAQRLDAEHDNLRAAFDYARTCAQGDHGERMLRLARAVGTYLWSCGHLDECQLWLDEALERGAAAPSPIRARALEARATLARYEGDWRQALHFVEASLALFQETDDPFAMGWALYQRGVLAVLLEGDPRRGLAYAESALEQFKRVGSAFGIAATVLAAGIYWAALGEASKAESALGEAYRLYEGIGNFNSVGSTLRWLARVNHREATQLFERALTGLRATADQGGLMKMLRAQAVTLMDEGANERGACVLRECLDLLERAGGGLPQVNRVEVEMYLGIAEYRLGHIDAAVRHHEAAFHIASATGFPPGYRFVHFYFLAWYTLARGERALAEHYAGPRLRYSLESGNRTLAALQLAQQAELARLRGNLARAARLAGAAATLERQVYFLTSPSLTLPAPWIEYQQALTSVRTLNQSPELAAAWAQGQQMTMDEAVAYALQDSGADQPLDG